MNLFYKNCGGFSIYITEGGGEKFVGEWRKGTACVSGYLIEIGEVEGLEPDNVEGKETQKASNSIRWEEGSPEVRGTGICTGLEE